MMFRPSCNHILKSVVNFAPIKIFGYGLLGFVIEWILILLYVTANFITIWQLDLLDDFQFTDGTDTKSALMTSGAAVTAVIYILIYFSFRFCDCFHTMAFIEQRSLIALLNITFHFVYWPIFLSMALSQYQVVQIIAYWFSPFLVLVGACCFGFWTCMIRNLCDFITDEK